MNKLFGSASARVIALVVLIVSAVGMIAVIQVSDIHLTKTPIYPADDRQLSSLPSETPNWVQLGSDRIESPEIVETLGTENYVTRYYVLRETMGTDRPIVIELHGAYYTGMIDTVPHVPERCFVGGGLQQSKSSRVMDLEIDSTGWMADSTVEPELAGADGVLYTVRLPNDPKFTDAPGRRVRLPKGVGPDSALEMKCSEFLLPDGSAFYAGYFFIANGGTVASANGVRTLAFNLSEDYAYYLKIQVNSSSVESIEELAEVSSGLIGELMGEIMRCVPDWVEVGRGNYPIDARVAGDTGT